MESAKFLYDYDKVAGEIEAIEKRAYLKKRYVTQYRLLKEREQGKRKQADELRQKELAKKRNQETEFKRVNLNYKIKVDLTS